MSGNLLSIREPTNGDNDSFEVELTTSGGTAGGIATLPRGQLAGSDLAHVLAVGDVNSVAVAVDEYRQALARAIVLALAQPLPLSDEEPLTVVIAGGPGIHVPIWEALRDPSSPPGRRALVVRVPHAGAATASLTPPPMTTGELIWLGARPFGRNDIPRHAVVGEVLAAMLHEDSSLRPRAIRTNAAVTDLEPLLLTPGQGSLVTHLDGHGSSRTEPGGDLVDAVFSFLLRDENGPAPIDDERLRSLLAAAGCTLFTTNACFGAQQRGVMEPPLPAQIVEDGAEVSIAAREPLAAGAAAVFFRAFYGFLSRPGTSIATAFAVATDALMPHDDFGAELGPERGRALRALLQPVLWASDRSRTDRAFAPPTETQPSPGDAVREAVAMSSFDGTMAAVAAAVEDAVWEAPPSSIQLRRGAGCGLSPALLEELSPALAHVCRPGAAVTSVPTELAVAALSEHERSWLICRRFKGRSAFLQLLVELLDDDFGYLDALHERSDGQALPALLDALSWGASAPDPSTVDIADAELAPVMAERRRRLEHRQEEESLPDIVGQVAALPLALPLTSFGGDPLFGVGTIAARGDPDGLFETFEDGQVAVMLRVEEELVVVPHPRTQLLARAAVDPALMVLMRDAEERNGSRPEELLSVAWNRGTRLACLSWISLAVALRQLGGIDITATTQAIMVLSGLDRGAAPELIAALEEGLPDWEAPIDQVVSALAQIKETLLDGELIESRGNDPADHALRLLHEGNPEAVLKLIADTGQLDFEEHKALCYALARTGRPEAAREGAARYLPQLATMGLWDQCELLHLLGDLAEREGKIELAARFMLDERKLGPPAARVRLHNHTHLITVLFKLPQRDIDLMIQLMKETVLIAAGLDREDVRQRYLSFWIHLVVGEEREAKLAELGELEMRPPDAESPEALRLARGVALLHEGGREREAQSILLPLTEGKGWEAGQACLQLAAYGALTNEQLIEVLRRGAGVEHASEADQCRAWLIAELWRCGDEGEAAQLAEASAQALPRTVACILAACAAGAGEDETATELLGSLIADAGRHVLANPRLAPMVRSLPQATVANALDVAIGQLITSIAASVASRESDVDVTAALGRLAGILELALQGRSANPGLDPLATELTRISELFWDQERLEPAAKAREIACSILSVSGDRAKLAIEVGWLATLHRRRGRVRDSEVEFQRAIELGNKSLSGEKLSSIYGRYGNLLHDVGSYRAAVDLQWSSLCLISTGVADDAPRKAATLAAAAAGGPRSEDLGALWLLRIANLANCLIDLPDRATADFLVSEAVAQIDRADPADSNGREARVMVNKVAIRLGQS